jgi:hypothetical protein
VKPSKLALRPVTVPVRRLVSPRNSKVKAEDGLLVSSVRTDLLDAALAQDHDAVGEFQRLLLVVGDEDGGVAGAVVDLAQPAAQFLAHLGVERAERLVEQQHARLDRQRAGQRHALALAAGKLAG